MGPLVRGKFFDFKVRIPHDLILESEYKIQVKEHEFLVNFPTLEEYTLMAKRTATPIYPKDAVQIIKLLDINSNDNVLECGTGSGALSLHLAKMLHYGKLTTIDIRQNHVEKAKTFVSNFRRSIYLNRIDFHNKELESFQSDYEFDKCILDMMQIPSNLQYLKKLVRNGAIIVCYLPNMTQVMELVKDLEPPFIFDSCLEVEERNWEIKFVEIKWPELKQESKKWVCRPSHFRIGHTGFLVKLLKI